MMDRDPLPLAFLIRDFSWERFMNPMVNFRLQRAREALTMMGMMRGFGLPDLLFIVDNAIRDPEWAEAITESLRDETGIKFTLTSRQWRVIHSEIKGLIEERRRV